MHIIDAEPGLQIPLTSYKINKEEIIDFAGKFDQAPFHLDEEAAKQTMLGGLCASGWQTTSIATRMLYEAISNETYNIATVSISACKWLRPFFVNDTISGAAVLVERSTNAEMHSLTFEFEITNQRNEIILTMQQDLMLTPKGGSND